VTTIEIGAENERRSSYIGPRSASQSNALIKGAADDLPGYFYTGLSLSISSLKPFRSRETSIAVRVNNVLNQSATEPGFSGVDVPAQGTSAFLTLIQSL
jgi:hypothetical protein